MDKITEQAIYEMLTESTGTHFLDSGGATGRYWQQNQKRTLEDFKKDELVVYDSKYDEITLNIFPFLNEHLEYEEEQTENFNKFIDDSKVYRNNTEYAEKFLNIIYGFKKDIGVFNSYNCDSCLSQVIQFVYAGDFYEDNIIALSIHNGADVRGGYTDYKIFSGDYESLLCMISPEQWDHLRDEYEDKPQPDQEYLNTPIENGVLSNNFIDLNNTGGKW